MQQECTRKALNMPILRSPPFSYHVFRSPFTSKPKFGIFDNSWCPLDDVPLRSYVGVVPMRSYVGSAKRFI